VAQQIAPLGRIAGDHVAACIRREPDPLVACMSKWPHRFDAARARTWILAEDSFGQLIRIHIGDELG
jgi:hypothetical protein